MKTTAVRLYGVNDLRLESFELPPIKDDEILVKIVSDSICMSTYKAAMQGPNHKRVPADIDKHPVIVGHEFCGVIQQVGSRWQDQFKPGEKFSIQPAMNGAIATPGYAFQYMGGDATYAIIDPQVMETDSLLKYGAEAFFYGSVAEPLSCIVGTFHAMYHTRPGEYVHDMGIVEGGNMAILAGAGPMGLGAIDYAIHCDRRPGMLVVHRHRPGQAGPGRLHLHRGGRRPARREAGIPEHLRRGSGGRADGPHRRQGLRRRAGVRPRCPRSSSRATTSWAVTGA